MMPRRMFRSAAAVGSLPEEEAELSQWIVGPFIALQIQSVVSLVHDDIHLDA